jgi:hypothetical protein
LEGANELDGWIVGAIVFIVFVRMRFRLRVANCWGFTDLKKSSSCVLGFARVTWPVDFDPGMTAEPLETVDDGGGAGLAEGAIGPSGGGSVNG